MQAGRQAPTYEDFSRWVVHVDGLEDGGPVIGDGHLPATPHALKDFVRGWGGVGWVVSGVGGEVCEEWGGGGGGGGAALQSIDPRPTHSTHSASRGGVVLRAPHDSTTHTTPLLRSNDDDDGLRRGPPQDEHSKALLNEGTHHAFGP